MYNRFFTPSGSGTSYPLYTPPTSGTTPHQQMINTLEQARTVREQQSIANSNNNGFIPTEVERRNSHPTLPR